MEVMIEDFIETYGEEVYWDTVKNVGHHSQVYSRSEVPTKNDEELAFALLEIIDFQCVAYGCYEHLTEDQIREFLIKHRERVRNMDMEPPSYMGAFVGRFDFLAEETKEEVK